MHRSRQDVVQTLDLEVLSYHQIMTDKAAYFVFWNVNQWCIRNATDSSNKIWGKSEFSTLGATCPSQHTTVHMAEKSTVYCISDSPYHVHPVTTCSVILTHCFAPDPTDLFWGENSTAITIADVDINTHRPTSCQETLKTSKIAHKHKGETLETIQKENNCVSLACSTLTISSQLLKVIQTLKPLFKKKKEKKLNLW